jgi:hypothetical protein
MLGDRADIADRLAGLSEEQGLDQEAKEFRQQVRTGRRRPTQRTQSEKSGLIERQKSRRVTRGFGLKTCDGSPRCAVTAAEIIGGRVNIAERNPRHARATTMHFHPLILGIGKPFGILVPHGS